MKTRLPAWAALTIALFIMMLMLCSVVNNIPTLPVLSTLPITANTVPSNPTPLPVVQLSPTPVLICPSGNCVDACLAKINSILQTNSVPQSPPEVAAPHGAKIQAITLVSYFVQGDQLSAPQYAQNIPSNLVPYQQDTVSQHNIWNYFTAMVPADQRTELTAFILSTDGKGGMLASVEESSNQPQDWALNVDPLDASKPINLTYTLAHEFGHLLTLNSTQVTPDPLYLANPNNPQIYQQESASCPQYFTTVGCSLPNSYINEFFKFFWGKLFNEWSQVNSEKDQNNYYANLAHFYERHPTQFISTYAATSPEEDIAESWAHFILEPKPAADSIAHEKMLFFYEFPNLVQLRIQMVNGICNYASASAQ